VYTVVIALWIYMGIQHDLPRVHLPWRLRCAVLALGLLSFAMECVAPEEVLAGENPILTANIFSIWTYSVMTPLMKLGAQEYITEDHLPSLLPQDESAKLGDDLQTALNKQ
jgi:ATP-binding cassette, subfamily C (CFTR/MRP), member 1